MYYVFSIPFCRLTVVKERYISEVPLEAYVLEAYVLEAYVSEAPLEVHVLEAYVPDAYVWEAPLEAYVLETYILEACAPRAEVHYWKHMYWKPTGSGADGKNERQRRRVGVGM